MNPFHLFALTEALLSNWASIRVLMGDAFERKKDRLDAIASRLQSPEELDKAEMERLLLQLGEDLRDTNAAPYFAELIQRSVVPLLQYQYFGVEFFGLPSALQHRACPSARHSVHL